MNEIKIGSLVRHKNGDWPADIGRVETWENDGSIDDGIQYEPRVFVRIRPRYGYSTPITNSILVNEDFQG